MTINEVRANVKTPGYFRLRTVTWLTGSCCGSSPRPIPRVNVLPGSADRGYCVEDMVKNRQEWLFDLRLVNWQPELTRLFISLRLYLLLRCSKALLISSSELIAILQRADFFLTSVAILLKVCFADLSISFVQRLHCFNLVSTVPQGSRNSKWRRNRALFRRL